jgi:P27 family predicted phage terminase small subunit
MPTPIKPSAILRLEKGNLHGEQADRVAAEPKMNEKLEPIVPEYLTKEEKTIWEYYAELMQNVGLFDAGNAAHLEMVAIAIAQFRKSALQVRKKGIIVQSSKGTDMYNPHFTALRQLGDDIRKLLNEIGLPSYGRAKLGKLAARGESKDALEELLD